ncbi:hypothetical protein BDZ91DRAFT_797385 [Kalaharituber pfeilii]|nr:hypothetical protein BDZ91DRAFT_797385 [Kalaharituber pfeilii]
MRYFSLSSILPYNGAVRASSSATAVESTRTDHVEVLQRDRDLMEADDYLTESKLDSLWTWFSAANRNMMDLQMIFVKLVNSVRKPYRDNLLLSRSLSTPGGTSRYTPSECTITEYLAEEQQPHYSEDQSLQVLHTNLTIAEDSLRTKQITINQLQDRITRMEQQHREYEQRVQGEKQQLERDLATIRAEHEKSRNLKPTYVAIKSGHWGEKYIQMTNDRVRVAKSIGPTETFELVRHPNGMVSFKSTCFPDTYMSAEAFNVRPGVRNYGGSVTCSNTCGSREKFWIHWPADARVGIEPVDFPGRFLMLNGNYLEAIRLQGIRSNWETFYIICVTNHQ